ncbi:MAG: 4-hydroxy-tetrahydrodipicolinate reductase, partial [Kiritimatiellae bacterium]|nr:4-hydroxy-tetrahydrodipicolinate reductase [Kiritimatiellia bacterium]
MKVAILGAAGRMGRMLVSLAEADPELEIAARIDVAEGYDRAWPTGTEAVVDFSFHEAVAPSVEKAAAEGVAYVIGTTGLTPEEQARVDACAAKIPVVQ